MGATPNFVGKYRSYTSQEEFLGTVLILPYVDGVLSRGGLAVGATQANAQKAGRIKWKKC